MSDRPGARVRIEGRGRTFRLSVAQRIDADLDTVFAFFAEARNLERITPPWMRFRIVGPTPRMEPGALIDYRLRLHGIPLAWSSEITAWDPPHRFVDVQRRGPFSLWEHEHTFERVDGGTLIRDTVDYAMPLARISSRRVASDLRAIFAYRQAVVPRAIAAGRPQPAAA